MNIKARLYHEAVGISAAIGNRTGLYFFPWQRDIANYKNIHSGKIGYLIGNGPSVNANDLDKLKGEITFCCNKFYMSYGSHSLRPTYTVSADDKMIEDFGDEIVKNSEGTVWFCSAVAPKLNENEYNWLYLQGQKLRLYESGIQKGVFHAGATLLAALQIGYYMGIRKFVLYGVDHNFEYTLDGETTSFTEGNHFISNYREGKAWYVPNTVLIEESFKRFSDLLEAQGGCLVNASRQSKLPYVRRVEFEEWIQEKG